ncbi:hypothetical protein [Acrocarpospora sp. B8E8]|uniref:hypothetical protein n=1 Tax=Acrocarpospora sp. B8E8 TaxID=3153572 RepID=UPI00325DCD3A
MLRLAAEFQGFTRDLHNLAVDICASEIANTNPALANVIQLEMTRNRNLDKGNANPGSLGADFGRLGLLLWPALEKVNSRAQTWNKHLEALNVARNAIAHSDPGGLARLQQLGYPTVTLGVAKKWRVSLDALATAMDDVVADYLARLIGGQRPW